MHPFSLGRLFKVKGERPFMIHVHYGRDQKGLVKLMRRMEGLGCKVLKVFMMMDGDRSCAKLVVDLKDVDVEEFRKRVGRGFETFDIRPTLIKGLMADLFTFPIEDDKRRFILSSIEVIKGIKKSVRLRYGPVFDAMIFHAGVDVGREACRGYYATLRRYGFKDAVHVLCGALTACGYAKAEPVFDDEVEDRCLIILHDNLECELEMPANSAKSNFIRGLIMGGLEEAMDREVEVRETSCIAKGDEVCAFYVELVK